MKAKNSSSKHSAVATARKRRKLPHEWQLSRRTMLRGVLAGSAVSFAVPLLEVMLNQHGDALADGEPLPRRFVNWMWGNGCRLEHWVPKDEGPDFELSAELSPLANVRQHCTVLSNFRNYVAGRRGHHDGMAGLWTGRPFIQQAPEGGAPYSSKVAGKSIDQTIADMIGDQTFHASVQMGVTRRYEDGQGSTLTTMSHRGPDTPLPMLREPDLLYDLLFSSIGPSTQTEGTGIAKRRSAAIDAVMQDLSRLRKRVSQRDAQRLDAHVESLFQLQKQIMSLPPACELPSRPDPLGPLSQTAVEDMTAINSIMAELLRLAFACDITRVASFMFTGPSGGQWFHELPLSAFPEFPQATMDYSKSDQHSVSHINNPYEQFFIHKSVEFCMKNFAVLLEKFAATGEGDSNLLDQSIVYASSDVAEGWIHSEVDFPIVLAGSAGGRLKRAVGHYRSKDAESLSNIGLACLKALAPDPSSVSEWGADENNYKGRSTTPCSAIWPGSS